MASHMLVFRRDGEPDLTEYRDSNRADGLPQINGEHVVSGRVCRIPGVDWLLTQHVQGEELRFVCTPVDGHPPTGRPVGFGTADPPYDHDGISSVAILHQVTHDGVHCDD